MTHVALSVICEYNPSIIVGYIMSVDGSGSSFFAGYMNLASMLQSESTQVYAPQTSQLQSELQDDTTRHISVPVPAVEIDLSPQGKKVLAEDGSTEAAPETTKKSSAQETGPKAPNGRALSQGEIEVIHKLRSRDAEVRAHENAHIAAAGGLASAASYNYQSGPDGKRYAIGGHVNIDTSPGRNAEETLLKAERIRSAALAPADPSAQDRAVAAQATQMAANARAEIAAEKSEELQEAMEGDDDSEATNTSEESSAENTTAQKTYSSFQNTTGKKEKENVDVVA